MNKKQAEKQIVDNIQDIFKRLDDLKMNEDERVLVVNFLDELMTIFREIRTGEDHQIL